VTDTSIQPEQHNSAQRSSILELQRGLRTIFRDEPVARALSTSLAHIGEHLGGDYLVAHARLGTHFLSEEFSDEFEPSDQLREFVNTALAEAMANGKARCVRLSAEGSDQDGPAVVAALLHDEDDEQAGAAAILIQSCSRERALETLSGFESTLGFLSLLITRPQAASTAANKSSETALLDDVPADNPQGLAFHAAAQLRNCHDIDQTAVGFVRGRRVDVTAICGLDEVRSTNPGVKLIRGAMEECLDADAPILQHGPLDRAEPPDCDFPLHRHWSDAGGGDTIATFPLRSGGRVVAVVALRQAPGNDLEQRHLRQFQSELSAFGRLVPLADRGARELLRHAVDDTKRQCATLFGNTKRRLLFSMAATLALVLWLTLGSLPYSLTVPAELDAAGSRNLSCPRDGRLERVLVHPGDIVQPGQVLAELDDRDDQLQRAELQAKFAGLQVEIDQALATGTPIDRAVLESRRRTLAAEIATAEHRIERAVIRANIDGTVLRGDLQELVGARVTEGQPMFQIADLSHVRVHLKIPEKSILMARDYRSAVFSPAAEPNAQRPIEHLHFPPAATTEPHGSVFVGKAILDNADGHVAPGMEGVAHLDLGSQNAFWVLTHRITDWLRLSFWL